MIRRILKRLKSAPGVVGRKFWGLSRIKKLIIGAPLLFIVLSVAAIEVTGTTEFCNSCHIMNDYHASWQTSDHNEVNCLKCHLQPGFAGYVKGKINGLAQAVDCAVGRIGTKPSATVEDISCLRSDCHSTEELMGDSLEYGSVRFTHENHIDNVVGGVRVTCGTCHSHFEGNQHFSVNDNACFACHFLAGEAEDERLTETSCRDCHELPKEVIRRGFVTIDHSEFVSYAASCEESCHKREVRQASQVGETVCLTCHDFHMEADANSVELHASHSRGEKVECFACHGKVAHGQKAVESISAMMDCRSCHSDTHQVQRTIYSTEYPAQPHSEDRVLSPMFLTHVECTGCHVERTARVSGTLDSFGTVARAVPAACDKCHEDGTGQKYVPFWQEQTKSLYDQVDAKVTRYSALADAQTDDTARQRMRERVDQARKILDSVRFDGSWGVHNFKYTESLLLEAEKTVSNGS